MQLPPDSVVVTDIDWETYVVFLRDPPAKQKDKSWFLEDKPIVIDTHDPAKISLPEGKIGYYFYDKLKATLTAGDRTVQIDSDWTSCDFTPFNQSRYYFPGGRIASWEELPNKLRYSREKDDYDFHKRVQTCSGSYYVFRHDDPDIEIR
ncbi:MAG: hypothetical protein JWM56_382 [Candidatus Peribacteria bacterium]|nr:hypothetical protein [Candidatus Peribacteria bacterium]